MCPPVASEVPLRPEDSGDAVVAHVQEDLVDDEVRLLTSSSENEDARPYDLPLGDMELILNESMRSTESTARMYCCQGGRERRVRSQLRPSRGQSS